VLRVTWSFFVQYLYLIEPTSKYIFEIPIAKSAVQGSKSFAINEHDIRNMNI
jgi:hypothetical protein